METTFNQRDMGDEQPQSPIGQIDDATHPDGSQSNIPYWVRQKLSQMDSLAQELIDYFNDQYQGANDDQFNLMLDIHTNAEAIMNSVTEIQENEGWI